MVRARSPEDKVLSGKRSSIDGFNRSPLLVSKMGRELNMDLIPNEKSRYRTFQKRKKGLMKKTYELATLCGIDACIIVFGPKFGYHPIETETWPLNPDEVQRIIHMYKAKLVNGKRTFDVSDVFPDRKKEVESQIDRVCGDNAVAKYTASNDALNRLSQDQIRELLGSLDSKLEAVKARIDEFKKESQQNMEATSSQQHMEATSPGINIGVTNQQQQPAYVEPLDVHPPTQYTPVEQNPMMGPSMLMMWMNNNDYAQFGNAPSGNMLYTPYAAPLYHNPTAVMQENMMLDNTMQVPCYTPTFMYYPMVSMGVTPPMQPMLPYYDFSGSQMNGREANS